MTEKLIRDALGDAVPQLQNEDGTFTVLSNGDPVGVDFGKKKLLRDALGTPLPMQYFDVEQDKFIAGNLTGESVDFVQIVSDLDSKLSGQLEELITQKTAIDTQGILTAKLLDANTHINDVKQNGVYRFTNVSAANVGLLAGTYIMTVERFAGLPIGVRQTITLLNTGNATHTWIRVNSNHPEFVANGGWSPIVRTDAEGLTGSLASLTTSTKLTLTAAINEINNKLNNQGIFNVATLGNGINIDNVRQNGSYRFTTTINPTNIGLPSGTYIANVFSWGDTLAVQHITHANISGGLMAGSYLRVYNNGVWTPIVRMDAGTLIGNLTNLTTTNKTNIVSSINEINNGLLNQGTLSAKRVANTTHPSFDDIVQQGSYFITSPSNMPSNGPSEGISYGHLIVIGHNLYPIQILQHIYQNTTYIRVKTSGTENKWTAWERLDTGGLSRLTTTNKTTVVDSINELDAKITNIQLALVELAEMGGV